MPSVAVTLLAWAWLTSRGFRLAALVCLVMAAAGTMAADTTLRLPFVQRSLPLPLVIVLAASVVVVTPLQNRFGALESSLVRGRLDRGLAGMLACGLAVLACIPAAVSAAGRFPWSVLIALLVFSVGAVVAAGPLAWLATVVAGLAVTYVDLAYAEPIRSALDALGVPTLLALLLGGLYVFLVRGPRA